ncbi:TPA: AAA family ATPase [Photobacterium damselae]
MNYYIKRVRVNGLFSPENSLIVDFEKDLNCIYGYNGTGKTVLINLIVHSLDVSLKNLVRIPFKSITILISRKRQAEKFITVSQSHDGIKYQFHIDPREQDENIDNSFPFATKKLRRKIIKDKEYIVNTRPINEITNGRLTPIYIRNFIQSYIGITFVPLFRNSINIMRNDIHHFEHRESENILDGIQGEFARQYASAQSIIARKLESLSSDILQKLFLSSGDTNYNQYESEAKELLLRRKPNDHSLAMSNVKTQIRDLKLDIPLQIIEEHYNSWYKIQLELIDADNALKEIQNPKHTDHEVFSRYSKAYINFVTTYGMYNKLQDAISEIESVHHKKYLALSKFENFKSAINDFLSENKRFNFDDDGTFSFTHNGNPVRLEHLSSGEQQLIAILGRLCTAKESASTFITDEPEISLHLEWQRKILPTIKKLSPSTQIIVATHSPAIMSKKANIIDIEKCYKLDDLGESYYV